MLDPSLLIISSRTVIHPFSQELHSTPLEELSAASFRPVCVKIRIPPTHPLLYAPSPLTPPDTPAATEFIPLTPRTPLSLPQTPALSNSSNPTGFPSPLRSLPLSRPSIAQATSPTLPSVATAPPHRRSRTLAPTMATESSLSQISFVTRQGLVLVRGGDWEELEMERREQGLLGGEATWEGEGLAVWVDEVNPNPDCSLHPRTESVLESPWLMLDTFFDLDQSARLIKISLPVTSQPGPLSSRNRTVMTETHTVDPSNLSGDCLTFPSSSSFKSKLGFFRKKQKSTPSPVVQGDCGDNQSSCWGGEGFPSSCQVCTSCLLSL